MVKKMKNEIYILDEKNKVSSKIKKTFQKNENFIFKNVTKLTILEEIKNIPDLLILYDDSSDDILKIYEEIIQNYESTIIPVLIIVPNNCPQRRTFLKNGAFCCSENYEEENLYYSIINILTLLKMNRSINPLTGLLGNMQIQIELQKRFHQPEEFSILYFDLDNFKAYNDFYGFLNGDEVIRFTATTILNTIMEKPKAFLGHVGGDDFVLIITTKNVKKLCEEILENFAQGISDYFKEEDKKRGYIEIINRKGISEKISLTTLSIGVVQVVPSKYKSIVEISEAGALAKHFAKTKAGNSYFIL